MRVRQWTIDPVDSQILAEKTRCSLRTAHEVEQSSAGLQRKCVIQLNGRMQVVHCDDRVRPLAESLVRPVFTLTQVVKSIAAAQNPLIRHLERRTDARCEVVPVRSKG